MFTLDKPFFRLGAEESPDLVPQGPDILETDVSNLKIEETQLNELLLPIGARIVRYNTESPSLLYQYTIANVTLPPRSRAVLRGALDPYQVTLDDTTQVDFELVVLEQPQEFMSNVFYHGWLWPEFQGFDGVSYTTNVLTGFFNPIGVYEAETNGDVDINVENKILPRDILRVGQLKPMENHIHQAGEYAIEYGADTALIRYDDVESYKTFVAVGVDTRTRLRVLVSRVMMLPWEEIDNAKYRLHKSSETFVKDTILQYLKDRSSTHVGDFFKLD